MSRASESSGSVPKRLPISTRVRRAAVFASVGVCVALVGVLIAGGQLSIVSILFPVAAAVVLATTGLPSPFGRLVRFALALSHTAALIALAGVLLLALDHARGDMPIVREWKTKIEELPRGAMILGVARSLNTSRFSRTALVGLFQTGMAICAGSLVLNWWSRFAERIAEQAAAENDSSSPGRASPSRTPTDRKTRSEPSSPPEPRLTFETVRSLASRIDHDAARRSDDRIADIDALLAAESWSAAAESAEEFVRTAPNDSRGWRCLGAARAGQREWEAALAAYESARRSSPGDPETLTRLAAVWRALGDTARADRLLGDASALVPSFAPLRRPAKPAGGEAVVA